MIVIGLSKKAQDVVAFVRQAASSCAVFSRFFIERTSTTDVHLFVSVQALADETKRQQATDSFFKDKWKPL